MKLERRLADHAAEDAMKVQRGQRRDARELAEIERFVDTACDAATAARTMVS